MGSGNLECGVGLYFKIDSKSRYYVDYIMPESSAAATGVIQPGDVLENVDGHLVRREDSCTCL